MSEVRTAAVNGIEMDYCRFGKGSKIFVMLPGLSVKSVMLSADAVEEAYGMFSKDYTVYLFDRRKNLPETYSVYEMAEDTAIVMEYLGLKKTCMFGASQGGMMAQVIAIRHPELVERLVIGSSSSEIPSDVDSPLSEWIRLAEEKECEKLNLAFAKRVYPEAVAEAYHDFFIEDARTIRDEDLKRFVILAKGTEGFNVTEQLKKIECPVLILGSNDDRVLGGEASLRIKQELCDREDVECFMYDGYGHAAYDTAPDYKERLMKFFG